MSVTKTLTEAISAQVRRGLAEIRVSVPARVVSYDRATRSVAVQPLIRDLVELEDGTTEAETLPVIPGVPVEFPCAGGKSITLPIAKGDTGMLSFCDASLDKWLSEGGMVTPAEDRAFNLNDATFRPGVRSYKDAKAAPDEDAIVLGDDDAEEHFEIALASVVRAWMVEMKTWADGVGGGGTVPQVPSLSSMGSASVKVSR